MICKRCGVPMNELTSREGDVRTFFHGLDDDANRICEGPRKVEIPRRDVHVLPEQRRWEER